MFRLTTGTIMLCTVMVVAGIFQGGAANFIAGAVAADLATQTLKGNAQTATATVTGMIDGTGAVGAAITQYLVGFVRQTTSWDGVFTMLVIFQGVCTLFLSKLFYNDIKRVVQRLRHAPGHEQPLAR